MKWFSSLFKYVLLSSVIGGCASAGPLPSHVEEVPRGVRNNNPLNIIKTNIDWKGEVACEDKRFECFKEASYGIRAGYINLYSYHHRHGISSLWDVVKRWSPPHENDTDAVYALVLKELEGVGRVGPDNIEKLLEALILSENGYIPYDREYIREAIEDVRNTNGNNHNDWFHINRRSDESVERGQKGQETPMEYGVGEGRTQSERKTGSQGMGRQGSAMDKTYYSTFGGRLIGGSPFNCSPVWVERVPRNIWMDRDARRFLILYIRQECLSMEGDGWTNPNTPPHPHALKHNRAILRREFGRASQVMERYIKNQIIEVVI